MGRDAGHGEWVYLIKKGHEWDLMMFQCYYEGYDTYTLKYGEREIKCNRHNFIKQSDMTTKTLSEMQLQNARLREHTT